jgi:hypothetical protein
VTDQVPHPYKQQVKEDKLNESRIYFDLIFMTIRYYFAFKTPVPFTKWAVAANRLKHHAHNWFCIPTNKAEDNLKLL